MVSIMEFYRIACLPTGCLDPEGIPREVSYLFQLCSHKTLILCCLLATVSKITTLIFQFNEKFEYKCQDCICLEDIKTVKCQPKACPAPSVAQCTTPGFVPVNSTDPSNPCCSTSVCRKTQSIGSSLSSTVYKMIYEKLLFLLAVNYFLSLFYRPLKNVSAALVQSST